MLSSRPEFPPHATTHQHGGSDEIDATGLTGAGGGGGGTGATDARVYKTLVTNVDSEDQVGQVFGGCRLTFSNHVFTGTSLHIYWEAQYYVSGAGLTGVIRLYDITGGSGILKAQFTALTALSPTGLISGDIGGSLVDGHDYEIEVAVTGGGGIGSGDRIHVNSVNFVLYNQKV